MRENISILFVAFEFPPLASGGVQRSLKFVKYLPDFNINPIVITVKESDYPLILSTYHIDKGLSIEIPKQTIIKRIHCASPKPAGNKFIKWARVYFSVTENFKKYWYKNLNEKLPEIIRTYKPLVVYVTIPPFAMAPLWLRLLKDFNIPLIIDFRDAWSQWALVPNGSYLHFCRKLKLEAAIVKKAAAIITTTQETKDDLLSVHKSIPEQKITVIPNGYDGLTVFREKLHINKRDKIVVGYVGRFYYSPEARESIFMPWWKKKFHRMLNYVPRKEDWLYRSPYFFLKALKFLIESDPDLGSKIEVRFAGKTEGWLKDQIESFGLEKNCTHFGYLDHDSVLRFQHNCDALMITSAKVVNGRDYSIAGKTFEYFTIGKPILAFVCEGAQKDILRDSGMAVICDPDNTKAAAGLMKELFEGSLELTPSKTVIEQYERKKLTQKLAGVIKAVLGL